MKRIVEVARFVIRIEKAKKAEAKPAQEINGFISTKL
jgi:hypothetical protein